MPITQARMLSLLAAAQDYQQALEQLTQKSAQIKAELDAGYISPAEACAQYARATAPYMLLQYPSDSPVVIKFESVHFAREKRRNERKAEKLRENRLADSQGMARPDRGDGGAWGKLGGPKHIQQKQHTIQIEPNLDATAPKSSLLMTRGIAVPSHYGTERKSSRVESSNAAELEQGEELDEELDFGEVEPGPSPLSAEQKREIERDMEAASLDLSQFTCQHPGQTPGQLCKLCQIRVPGAGPDRPAG